MRKFKFIIEGNQEKPDGNPIPKIKKTKGQQWSPQAQRYAAWKNYVQHCFWLSYGIGSAMLERKWKLGEKPIGGVPKATMNLKIYWANEAHADPESVFGSIADALFENDKHLNGSFKAIHSKDKKGWVEVEIEIMDE